MVQGVCSATSSGVERVRGGKRTDRAFELDAKELAEPNFVVISAPVALFAFEVELDDEAERSDTVAHACEGEVSLLVDVISPIFPPLSHPSIPVLATTFRRFLGRSEHNE